MGILSCYFRTSTEANTTFVGLKLMGIRVSWSSLPHLVVKVFSCHTIADAQLLSHFLLLFSAPLLLSIDCFYAEFPSLERDLSVDPASHHNCCMKRAFCVRQFHEVLAS